MSILISIFISGYHGKTTDFAKKQFLPQNYDCPFPQFRKWDDSLLSDTLKCSVIEIIYSEAARTGKPVFRHCGRYDCFKDKAFVTGFTSD